MGRERGSAGDFKVLFKVLKDPLAKHGNGLGGTTESGKTIEGVAKVVQVKDNEELQRHSEGRHKLGLGNNAKRKRF